MVYKKNLCLLGVEFSCSGLKGFLSHCTIQWSSGVNLGFNRAVQIAGGMLAHSEFKLNQPNLNCAAAKVTFGAASGCSKKKCSDFDETGCNRPESIKCGANLVSDEKVNFSPKKKKPPPNNARF